MSQVAFSIQSNNWARIIRVLFLVARIPVCKSRTWFVGTFCVKVERATLKIIHAKCVRNVYRLKCMRNAIRRMNVWCFKLYIRPHRLNKQKSCHFVALVRLLKNCKEIVATFRFPGNWTGKKIFDNKWSSAMTSKPLEIIYFIVQQSCLSCQYLPRPKLQKVLPEKMLQDAQEVRKLRWSFFENFTVHLPRNR